MDCLLCKKEERGSRGACWATNATYMITCNKCEEEGRDTHYVGETGFSGYSRGLQHMEGLRRRDQENVLYNHNIEQHREQENNMMIPNDPSQFTMKKIGQHRGCLERQSTEGALIGAELRERDIRMKSKEGKPMMILNSKKEFHQPGLISLKPSSIKYDN